MTVAALTLGVFAPAAGAATAQVTDDGTEQVLTFTAAPGEVNVLTLAAPDVTNSQYSFVDRGAGVTITPGAGCTPVVVAVGSAVNCAPAGLDRIEILLDDGADHMHLYSSNIPVRVDAGAGDDTLEDSEGGPATAARSVEGGEGDDYFSDKGDGVIPDDYKGGSGKDTASYEYRATGVTVSVDDVPNDGAGAPTPTEGDNVHTDVEVVFGSTANDKLVGSPGNDTLVGLAGADDIQGLDGADQLEAWGSGAPGAVSPCDVETLDGGAGADRLFAGGRTTAHGGPDDDQLMGDDELCAGGGDDVHGDEGKDLADFSVVSGPLSVSLDDQANDGWGGKDNFHADIEDLYGGAGGMTLIGNAGENNITGGSGNDVVDGRAGKDQLHGGAGVDLADYSAHTAAVSLTLDSTDDNDGAADEHDSIALDVENLRGGSGNDTLAGGVGSNVLDGGLGADTISGGAGVDAVDYSRRSASVDVSLAGGAADDGETGENDNVAEDVEGAFGGAGNDKLAGNAEAGVLSGGAGNDELRDSGGADAFDAGPGNDAVDSVDGFADTVACGAGTDSTTADAIDTVGADCEPPPGPGPDPDPDPKPNPGPSGPTGPTTPVKPIDRTAPLAGMTLPKGQKLRGLRSKGLKISVLSNESGRLAATLTAESKTRGWLKRQGVSVKAVLASGKGSVTAGVRKSLTLRLTAKGRKALRGLRSAKFKLVVVVTDPTGNKRTVTKHLAMR